MNAKMLELLEGDASKYPKFIEANYPHIFNNLIEYWGTHQMTPYLDELMMSKRSDRQGFPPEAATEVWAISSLYAKLRPAEDKGLGTDVWQTDVETAHSDWKEAIFSKDAEDKDQG